MEPPHHDRDPRSHQFAWKLTPHICATCFGRVLESLANDGGLRFLCASCGAAGDAPAGTAHPPICACAMRVGKRDARIRCRPNPRPRAALPFEIVAAEAA